MPVSRYREKFDTERVLNVANIITAARIVLIPFFVQFIIQDRYTVAFYIFVICGLTDAFDGFIARVFQVKSKFGMLLDPIGDKALMATSFIILGIYKKIPLWLVVITISRDTIILLGSLLIIIFIGMQEIATVPLGKANTVLQIATIGYILFLLSYPDFLSNIGVGDKAAVIKTILFVSTGGTTLLSGIHYFVNGFKKLSRI
jgi:cardiolipin synthase